MWILSDPFNSQITLNVLKCWIMLLIVVGCHSRNNNGTVYNFVGLSLSFHESEENSFI